MVGSACVGVKRASPPVQRAGGRQRPGLGRCAALPTPIRIRRRAGARPMPPAGGGCNRL